MKRCIKCIMPETAKGIILDANGLCQLCKNYKPYMPKGEEALRNEIQPYLTTHSEYDCLVPLSGGRDSTYALYYTKKVLKLKPLAMHNDNDFVTDVATANLEITTKQLDVPLIRMGSKNHLSKKIVREKFIMNARFGAGLVVDQTCEACKYGFESAAYNMARKHNIALIFWGDSVEESTEQFHDLSAHTHPSRCKRLLSPTMLNYIRYKYNFCKMKKEYGQNSKQGLKEIHLYDYIKWDRRVIIETIKKEVGWTVPENAVTTWRTDCSLVPIVNYLTGKAYGVTKMELGFSNMIRSGKMDREEALRQVELIRKNWNIERAKNLLNEIGIPQKIIDAVLGLISTDHCCNC
ncbi:MAG: hypothetical protein ONB27_07930 [candidate division KSB1 bacterium]|nr:hypothetical protein [candidate division KSB1 bacterium]